MNEQDRTSNRVGRMQTSRQLLQQSGIESGRLQPQALDLEEAVLGAMMLNQDAVNSAIDILKPESFYKPAHQNIFECIVKLFQESEPIDILSVTQALKKAGQLELAGGAYFISQLTTRIASTANVEFHARIIAQKYIQRELIRISNEIMKDAYEETSCSLHDRASQKHLLFLRKHPS